jgi:hypothetical protein
MTHNTDESPDPAADDTAKSTGGPSDQIGRDPDKPMSDTQRTYLEPLAESQDEQVKDDMSEEEAARAIDRLQDNAVHVY